jgi:hypothetical protein
MDMQEYVPYRAYNFLDQPGVPQHVKWDKETVYLHWPGQDLPVRYDTGVDVYMGFSDLQLREQLSKFERTRLLHFENLEPHSFSGFTDPKVCDTHAWDHTSDCTGLQHRQLTAILAQPNRSLHAQSEKVAVLYCCTPLASLWSVSCTCMLLFVHAVCLMLTMILSGKPESRDQLKLPVCCNVVMSTQGDDACHSVPLDASVQGVEPSCTYIFQQNSLQVMAMAQLTGLDLHITVVYWRCSTRMPTKLL